MNIVILHYHFNRGGVTQVVLNQLRALDAVVPGGDPLRVALVHGGRREGVADEQLNGFRSIALSTHAVPALDYDDGAPVRDAQLAGEIRAVLSGCGFSADGTLLHVHNHSLGKNVSLPGAIRRLAGEGFRMLLQMHDFAEDLRPANYRRLSAALASGGDPAAALYPQATHIHYAVLNGRDFGGLSKTGIDEDRLHLLPNAVAAFGSLPAKAAAREKLHQRFDVPRDARYVLYPVRAIRRKNLGEMLLWSAAGLRDAVFAVTLQPLNPTEANVYRHWKRLAAELGLPCRFETGSPGGLEFLENLAAADFSLTTSIAEGFGMVFLETWLAELNLLGRDLPEITADFAAAGMQFDGLYDQLRIPIDWIGRDELQSTLSSAYRHLLRDYGAALPSAEQADQRVAAFLPRGHIDFAVLNGAQQAQVIRRIHSDDAARDEFIGLNPLLPQAMSDDPPAAPIAANAEVVRRNYSLGASGRRLWDLYETVAACPVAAEAEELPHAERILAAFLDVSRLQPIRFET